MAPILAEVVLAYIHFLFFYVVFAAQISVPRQTRTPAFISLLQELEHRVSGKFLRGNFILRVPPGKLTELPLRLDQQHVTTIVESAQALPEIFDRIVPVSYRNGRARVGQAECHARTVRTRF